MNAPDLFALLDAHGPGFGVTCPEGQQAVFWNAYFRELREFRAPAVDHAFAAWKRGDFDPKNPMLGTIFPTPAQLVSLARQYRDPDPIADAFRLPLTPADVAARLRAQADAQDDVGIVL